MTTDLRGRPGPLLGLRRRLLVLGERDFRRFFVGYTTSLLGSSMAGVAVAFAVLATGGGGSALGAVMTARILPLVLLLLFGGVAADRFGSRIVMIVADVLRCGAQATFAVLLLTGRPDLWVMLVLSALAGIGEGLFGPSLSALIPRLSPRDGLTQANSLLQIARSGATVAGPALAGVLVATGGPALVLALDAASYAVSVLVVFSLPPAGAGAPGPAASAGRGSLLVDLRAGWSLFRSQTWLWVTTLHICLFNLLVWGPFLVLGPVVSATRLGGAGAWGAIMACYGCGAITGGFVLLGRRPSRPLFVAVVASLGWAFPTGALAVGLPLVCVCAGALVAGIGSSLYGTLIDTLEQQVIPVEFRGRVAAYGTLGAFGLGPLGLAAAGPVAAVVGAGPVLAGGSLWLLGAVVVLLLLPAIRRPVRTSG
ncbi:MULTISPECIES: MFS transporter [Streptacidiphilus]|uniref:MFS transporter n=1 Tax=Streptacidiphilus cavernicola TaxID=3342716 RepID=A0ABV6UT04_9ACTN|nr:MFS transporter [Streptacidiphilus jeojiense]